MADLEHVSSGDPHVAAHNEERDRINQIDNNLSDKLNKPDGTAHTGETLIYDGENWSASSSRIFEGTGSPEGEVAAPVGSRYIDLDASKGAIEWIKRSGSGNTGWLVVFGDTGWRNVASMVMRRGTAVVTSAYLRRVNSVVDIFLDVDTPHNNESPWTVLTLPEGFRPAFHRLGVVQPNNGSATNGAGIQSDGSLNFYFPERDARDRYNACYTTTDTWPTAALPGTPA